MTPLSQLNMQYVVNPVTGQKVPGDDPRHGRRRDQQPSGSLLLRPGALLRREGRPRRPRQDPLHRERREPESARRQADGCHRHGQEQRTHPILREFKLK